MKKRKPVFLLLLLAVLVAGGAAVFWARAASSMDPDARPKTTQNRTPEEWSQYLQEQADLSQLRFKVNTAITVDADGSADLLLENAAENLTDLQAVLTLSDGTTLYQSDVLPPGGQALLVYLEDPPAQGSHTGTVTIQALDRTSGAVTGQAEMEVTVQVKEVGP